ncbi:hypothetical protein F4827_002893 [Paraburkholderia bannensis]|uniref:Uncharacterized protein n=1 Tax=Paraburkholderia bannensis TaxID=765414 RepID=A0A7W9TZ70_9BURK|nr:MULTISPECIES: hypothetical protein [Paraburkholderia]MBB3258027.1 hypothetical protein [Paraburkholderia sp. WP4_3_2]MBB6103040.1 hypothetical protein [Paraburkholderia bannensis]
MTILKAIPIVSEYFASDDDRNADSWRSGLHSGNIGDIVYALPTCRMLDVNHLILNVCADPGFGGRVLTDQAAKALVPLLFAQKFVRRVTIIKSGVPWEFANPADLGVDYILDSFRASFTNPRLHLVYAHATPFNLMIDGARPWITIDAAPITDKVKQQPYIVVGLTNRYRRFDHAYYEYIFRDVPADRVFFVGVGSDQIERRNIGGTVFQTESFLDLAKLLANSALFIGNPSFAYAMAEGLKVNRLVEVPEENNVYPLDGTGSLIHMTSPEAVRARVFEALQLEDHSRISWENALPAQMLANMPSTQLYFDSGSGFNEIESLRRSVIRGARRYVFGGFPQNEAILAFRFDPVDDHTIVRINKVCVTSEAGELVLNATPLNATYVFDAAECCFTHNDPQFIVHVPAEHQVGLKNVIVDMETLAIGATEVINRLYPRQFEQLTEELSQLATTKIEMIQQYGHLLSERDQLVNDQGKTTMEFQHLLARLDSLTIEREQLRSERDHLLIERDQLFAERNTILKSRSWRVTAPLRRFLRMFAA